MELLITIAGPATSGKSTILQNIYDYLVATKEYSAITCNHEDHIIIVDRRRPPMPNNQD